MTFKYDQVRSQMVVDIACMAFAAERYRVINRHRDTHVEKARFAAYYLLRHEMGLSFPNVGHAVGGRDHTTAMHGVKRAKEMMRTTPGFLRRLQAAWEATKQLPDHTERVARPRR